MAVDAQYGRFAPAPAGLARPFLHAVRIALEAPGGGRSRGEPLPPDLQTVLVELGGGGGPARPAFEIGAAA